MNRYVVAVLASLALSASVGAQEIKAPPALTVNVINKGTKDPVVMTKPGDTLTYRLKFTNHGTQPAKNITFNNAIPAGLYYLDGTATASSRDVVVSYSADGGKSFSNKPMETVEVNGKKVERPIPASRYTHVRWVIPGPVAPHASVTAEYDVRVTDGKLEDENTSK